MQNSFTPSASFDFLKLEEVVATAVRMLDNVLDLTVWPLPQQDAEAQAKRRIGLGFTGLGDALVMLGVKYDSQAGLDMARDISEVLRDESYRASIGLAEERGAFPLLDAEAYLQSGYAKRLPDSIRNDIRRVGIRNSHLTSIAPTGTISMAFAQNVSGGIEPAFDWSYSRKKRMADSSEVWFDVEDYAYRTYREMGGDVAQLPSEFVSALQMSAQSHMQMVAAVAPFIDSAISKTVNVPADYDFVEFSKLYMDAWKAGLKGITTYRPNATLGSVLKVNAPVVEPVDLSASQEADPDRRVVIPETLHPATASLRWPARPKLPNGNPAWTYMVESERTGESFAVFVGHVDNDRPHPFEVWANGSEQSRGLGAVAKTLSMDMRAQDRAWLKIKLEALAKTQDDKYFELELGENRVVVSSASAALAKVVLHRLETLGVTEPSEGEATPVVDALFSRKEPKAGTDGTLAWNVDVLNPATGDDFAIFLKEATLPDGTRRPYSVWLAGAFPRELDGLCKLLSLDMRVIDPAWIGMKLRKLLSYSEPSGAFFAKLPGSEKSQSWPSTVAYVARLIIHRYAMLGLLDESGNSTVEVGVFVKDEPATVATVEHHQVPGKPCKECGAHAVIKRDGCEFCTACGAVGSCG